MTTRAESKAHTRQRLLAAAHETLRDQGAAALSLRDVARRAGIVPSAVYRHFASRDDLLTTLILAGYAGLADALEDAARPAAAGWSERADALRAWALAHRHEFQLLYGTPVPGYAAPADTVPAAARVAAVFVAAAPADGGDRASAFPRDSADALRAQLTPAAAALGTSAPALAWTLASLAQLVGLLLLELGGHLVGTADPADLLWRRVIAEQDAEREGAAERSAGA